MPRQSALCNSITICVLLKNLQSQVPITYEKFWEIKVFKLDAHNNPVE